jgi:TDG/mug DNA glycosylase family protein
LKPASWKPTRAQVAAAAGRTVADVAVPGLRILFVGINPGLYTAAIGRHFGRPGNRFWPALHAAGLTPRLFSPFESRELLRLSLGITNLVSRATARADEVGEDELRTGARRLERKVRRLKPALVAVLGLEPYRKAFGRPEARVGPQNERIGGAKAWLLPNPSGLNAHYQVPDLARLFRALGRAAGAQPRMRRAAS